MAQKHVLRFSAISAFFASDPRLINRGENAVESNHVAYMVFDDQNMMLRGEVHASMRNKTYKVQISLDSEWQISEGNCTCPRGHVLCHHIAALAIFGHYDISVTDVTCSWSARKIKDTEVKTIEELFPPKPHKTTDRKLQKEEIENLIEDLTKFDGAVGFTWLLSGDLSTEFQKNCSDIEEILNSKEYTEAKNPKEYFCLKLTVTPQQVKNIFEETVGQFKNEKWLMCRKHRLTASKFGVILAAIKRNRFTEALFKNLTDSYNLDGIRAIQWGRTHESTAIKFEQQSEKKIHGCGIWLHECGFLGASADGLIDDEQILEVKCPYKYRDTSLYEGLKENKNYIVIFEDDSYIINKNYHYFHQIQGQLHIMKKKICNLFIWTPLECILLEVERDDTWEGNIKLLKDFYLNVYLNQILK